MKFFIITLKGNSISEKYSNQCIEQAKKFGITITPYDAVNGLEYQSHLDRLQIKPRYKFKKGKPGVFGCFLSHYYLWKQCVEENTPYLILEHDGFIIRPLPENILDSFTDVLKLDNLDPYSKAYHSLIEEQKNQSIVIQKYVNSSPKFLEKNQTGNYIKGAYSYIIKPHAAKKILDWISANGFVPADQQIGDNLVDIRVTIPTVARLHPDYQNRIKELSLTGNPENI